MEAGERIWVESILSDEEYAQMSKKYPAMYTNGSKKVPIFECDFKWRWRMGGSLSTEEINLICRRMDEMLKTVRKTKIHEQT